MNTVNVKKVVKLLQITLLLLLPLYALHSYGAESFRLKGGQLLETGMNRAEILSLVGQPVSKNIEAHGINGAQQTAGKTIETWIYEIEGSIGGVYLVTITLEGGVAIAIDSKQKGRI